MSRHGLAAERQVATVHRAPGLALELGCGEVRRQQRRLRGRVQGLALAAGLLASQLLEAFPGQVAHQRRERPLAAAWRVRDIRLAQAQHEHVHGQQRIARHGLGVVDRAQGVPGDARRDALDVHAAAGPPCVRVRRCLEQLCSPECLQVPITAKPAGRVKADGAERGSAVRPGCEAGDRLRCTSFR